MIVTDDLCNELTWKIMELVQDHIDDILEDTLYDSILELLIKELESNGYVNHN